MTDMPAETLYHRWLGLHAPAMRRALTVGGIGLIVFLVLMLATRWELAVLGGWDASSVTLLLTVWPIIWRSDAARTEHLASREDETNGSATVLLLCASVASLLGVGFALGLASRHTGAIRGLLVALAVLTVVLSWAVLNTVYTLRYARLQYAGGGGIAFGEAPEPQRPLYRDFAYVAFTIGMTYQVSDTAVRDRRIRGTVLTHALLAYVFGVVIVAGAINLIAGLVR